MSIEIEYVDAVNMKLITDRSTLQDVSDYFSFRPKNYQFNPKFKNKIWDGYIRLCSPMKPYLYVGLLHELEVFCNSRDIPLKIPKNFITGDDVGDDYGYELAKKYNCPLTPHKHQNSYIVDAIRDGRSLNISPTSSGKSLIQYLIARHYIEQYNSNILIVVPRIQLTKQMKKDFVSYNCDENMISLLGDGVKDDQGKRIVVGTWQTLITMPDKFFSRFDVVLGDEAHTFESKSLTDIMGKLPNANFRHGFTGTISSESKVHQMVLEGLFGKLRKYISTSDLIEQNVTASLKVKMLMLKYPLDDRKEFKEKIKEASNKKLTKKFYSIERAFIASNEKRNKFIRNLVWSLKDQNNIIFFDHVDTHGKILADMLQREGRIVFFIHGNISSDKREKIREIIENDPIKRYDIVASSGTTSTGVSIKRIDNAIFTSGTKGEIKTLQSIGRLLRRGNGSDDAVLYDIGDLLTTPSNPNYSYQHFTKRLEIYNSENFDYKVYEIDL